MEALEASPNLYGGRKFPESSTQSMGVGGVKAEAGHNLWPLRSFILWGGGPERGPLVPRSQSRASLAHG